VTARVLATAALLLVLVGCGNAPDDSKRSAAAPLEVGYSFGFDAGDVGDRIAFRRVEQSGIRVRTRDMGSPTNAVAALTRGDIELANMPYTVLADAVANGVPIRAILGANMAPEFLLVGRPGIASVADLRGKVVVHSGPGTISEVLVRVALKRAGLGPRDVSLRGIQESPQKAAALVSGRAEGGAVEFVDYELLRRELPGAKVLVRQLDVQPRATVMVWVMKRSTMERSPARVGRIVAGLLRGYGDVYSAAGRRSWLELARKSVLADAPPGLAPRVYGFYRDVGFWPRRGQPVTQAQHDALVAYWRANGVFDGDLPFTEAWDMSFWPAAATG
jgi:ABC-type nitrate/sulfonate/bicarbonate transport system substrate-binding protein